MANYHYHKDTERLVVFALSPREAKAAYQWFEYGLAPDGTPKPDISEVHLKGAFKKLAAQKAAYSDLL